MSADSWRDTIQDIAENKQHLAGLALISPNGGEHGDDQNEFCDIGTLIRIHHPVLTSGKVQFIAEGIKRFKVKKWLTTEPPYWVEVEYPSENGTRYNKQLRAYAIAIINAIKELVPLNPLYSEEFNFFLNRFSANEPSQLADFAASLTTAKAEELQSVLECFNLKKRMEHVLVLIKKELEVARLQAKIQRRVDDKLSDHQRKFFLKEQLRAIQKELGIAKDDRTADCELFRRRIEGLELSEQANDRLEDELDKLSILEAGSPEYAVTRNYLDTVTQLPWGYYSEDNTNLKHAQRILDRHHAGLEDVKQRIIEFLAVGALTGEVSGSILLLVGPPGVGKTSIGHSIAEALGRQFYRFSLGGTRDEAEIKGHRRTYIGAMPGKFIQAMIETQTSNPVIMLDEIDKITSSYQGDPGSALLEILDPEQNKTFLDHYLDLRFDFSNVLFVCTANQLDTIPQPLLDRMEVIRLSGYITDEKMVIAQKYLWPKQLKKCGAKTSQIKISQVAMRQLIEDYAREAGVRSLEKKIGQIIRKAVVKIVNGEAKNISISQRNLVDFLGQPEFTNEQPMLGIGMVTGLAWTALGGAILSIEAVLIHQSRRGLKVTGSLGNVMKESAEIAYSYIRACGKNYGIFENYFEDAFVHLHVPEGATPKDGPSAGITMACALLSLALNKKPKHCAMTGEITITGQVLAVGGIREKIIAAKRVKIHEIILPKDNKSDYDKLPMHIRKGLTVHFVSKFDQVVSLVF